MTERKQLIIGHIVFGIGILSLVITSFVLTSFPLNKERKDTEVRLDVVSPGTVVYTANADNKYMLVVFYTDPIDHVGKTKAFDVSWRLYIRASKGSRCIVRTVVTPAKTRIMLYINGKDEEV